MRTVAIVGNASATLPYAKYSKADEFWSMNHLLLFQLPNGDIPRVDRLFEIHEENWFRRKELNESAEKYWDFLQQEHPFPIYMHDVHPAVPSSVKYPKDEIVSTLLAGFRDSAGEIREFFTSSVAWMFALAIYEGFDRIELYGCEMQYGTEYFYQQPGGTFWIGLALGRGIDVVLHEKSTLCRAKLYGYETAPYASRPTLEKYRDFYASRRPQLERIFSREAEAWNHMASNGATPDERSAQVSRLLNAHADVSLLWGGSKMLEILLDESDTFASRQKLEGYVSQYKLALEKWKGETNYRRASFNGYLATPGYLPEKANELFQQHVTAWEAMHRYSGGVQVLEKLMDECDMRYVDMNLVQQIDEMDEPQEGVL